MFLSELKIGEHAVIESILDEGLSLRLYEMGCLPGVNVFMQNIAPLGDPMVIKVGDYLLGLRKNEASKVSIVPSN